MRWFFTLQNFHFLKIFSTFNNERRRINETCCTYKQNCNNSAITLNLYTAYIFIYKCNKTESNTTTYEKILIKTSNYLLIWFLGILGISKSGPLPFRRFSLPFTVDSFFYDPPICFIIHRFFYNSVKLTGSRTVPFAKEFDLSDDIEAFKYNIFLDTARVRETDYCQ